MDPRTCILGIWEESTIKAAIRCLFQARKLIAQRWQAVNPPTISEWTNVVTATVWKEKAVYAKRGNIKEFDKIWKPWLLRIGYSV